MDEGINVYRWDEKANEWKVLESMAEVFYDKKICFRITMDGMVRYVSTDQPARPQLTRRDHE